MPRYEQLDATPIEAPRPTVITVKTEPVPDAPYPIVTARPSSVTCAAPGAATVTCAAPGAATITCAAPGATDITCAAPGAATITWWRENDKLAIAAAVCGFTPVIPVLSQLVGLALGVASLVRIRRARKCGVRLRGKVWALAGIISSAVALLAWVAILAAMIAMRMMFAHTAGVLDRIAVPTH